MIDMDVPSRGIEIKVGTALNAFSTITDNSGAISSMALSQLKRQTSFFPKRFSQPWLIGLGIGSILLTGGVFYYSFAQFSQSSQPTATVTAPTKVAALGRLEPEAEVLQLSAPLALDGDRILELRVKEGDRVKAGQIIAVLDSRDRLEDELRQEQEQFKIAQAKLDQVQAGAKSGEIAAQEAEIARLEADQQGNLATQAATIARLTAELRNAETEYKRYQMLYEQGAVSASQRDSKQLTLNIAQESLQEAQATLNRTRSTNSPQLSQAQAELDRIAEVRPVDIRSAQVEVDSAIASVQRATTALEKAYIRSPTAGQILTIQARPGEKIGDKGIVEMGQTSQMMAIAEVYQSDIGKVKVGQAATISSPAFPGKLRGTVSDIGREVKRQNTFSNQPGENLDRRIIEVKIRLENGESVAGLTNLQVQTEIDLDTIRK
jgi:HlyD family secretion protein